MSMPASQTVAGWRSRPALRRSPNGSCAWSGAPTWWGNRGSARRANAPATATCSMRRWRNGSPRDPLHAVCAEFERVGAALAPIYDVAQVMSDPHVQAREAITTVDDEDLGPLKMQNLMFRMQATPGAIRRGCAVWRDHDDESAHHSTVCDTVALHRGDVGCPVALRLPQRRGVAGRGARRWRAGSPSGLPPAPPSPPPGGRSWPAGPTAARGRPSGAG